MSTSRDSCCLPSVKKQKHDFQVFAFVQCIIKQLLDSVFVISRTINVSADPYLDLDYSGYHKNLIQYMFKAQPNCTLDISDFNMEKKQNIKAGSRLIRSFKPLEV